MKNNDSVVLCKFDIENKAYDHVDSSFLLSVIGKMGFVEKRIGWIKWCLSTTSFFILIMGHLPTLFKALGD